MGVSLRLRMALLVVQAGLGCAAGRAFAQQENYGGEPPPPTPERFHLVPSELYVGMEGEYQQRRVRTEPPDRRASHYEDRQLRLSPIMGVTLDGDIYDPNLLDYHAALGFGLTQSWFREEIDRYSNTDHDTSFLQQYDVSLDILKNKPVSFHVYARRVDDHIPRMFLPSLHEQVTETGVSMLAVKGPFTTEIGASYRDVDRTHNVSKEDNEDMTLGRFYLDHKWEISENQLLRLSYNHERDEDRYEGSRYHFDTSRDELRLDHELAFGSQAQHRLDTFVRYNEEHGDLARDEFEFVPRLALRHTDKFQTIWRYAFYRLEQDAIEFSQHKFDAQALYELTKELRLSLDGFGLFERTDQDVDTNESGANTDVTYHHSGSLGETSVNLAAAYEHWETHGSAGRRLVRDEAHAMYDVRPVFLRERDVVLGSIFVHNANRTHYFVPGLDYLVIPVGDRIRIHRVLTGRIAQDEVVYVDYEFKVPAGATRNLYRTSALLEHKFNFGLTPYYGFEGWWDNADGSVATPWFDEHSLRHRLGVRYDRERWGAGVEYEIFDDSLLPYDAFHLTGRYTPLSGKDHSLDVSTELSEYLFDEETCDRRVWWFNLNVKDRAQITPWISLESGAVYEFQNDSIDGRTNGLDLECTAKLIRGYLTVELTVEYDLLSIWENRDTGFGVFLNVRRDLSYLLPRAGAETARRPG